MSYKLINGIYSPRTEYEVWQEAAINAARISISHYCYGVDLRKFMYERAVKLGIVYG